MRSFVDGVPLHWRDLAPLAGSTSRTWRTHFSLTLAGLPLTLLCWFATSLCARCICPAYAENRDLVDEVALAIHGSGKSSVLILAAKLFCQIRAPYRWTATISALH